MAYRLDAHEAAPEGVRRVAAEQIGRAIKELGDRRRSRHKAIHLARKRFKKLRGLIRLVRPELGEAYATENRFYRDAGRKLSAVRDAEAAIEIFDRFHARFKDRLHPHVCRSVHETLVARRQAVVANELDLDNRVSEVLAQLNEARERAVHWNLEGEDFAALKPGFEGVYGRGRKAFIKAYKKPSAARFHESRKHTKYHWYHVRLLQNVWPRVMRGYRDSLRSLNELLGDDHDLSVLHNTLLEDTEAFGGDRERQILLDLIDRRQAELRAQAETIGWRVFTEKPARISGRMQDYWLAWRAESEPHTMPAKEPAVAHG